MNVNGLGPAAAAATTPASGGTSASGAAARDTVTTNLGAANGVAAPAAPVAAPAEQDSFSQEHIHKVIARTNSLLQDLQSPMRLEYRLENDKPQVDLVDQKTGTAIRTFPASSFVQMVHRQFVGLLMDNYA